MQPQKYHGFEDESIVYNSTRNYLALACGALLFVACGIAMDCVPSPGLLGYFFKAVGTLSIALFGICTVYCIRRIVYPSPDLILSNKGFFINLSAFASDWYEWKDLAEVNIRWLDRQKYLCITFHEANNPLKRLSWYKKLMMRINRHTVGADLTLPSDTLPVSSEKLLQQMQSRLELSRVLVRPAGDPHDAENLLLPYSGQNNETDIQQLLRAGRESKPDIE